MSCIDRVLVEPENLTLLLPKPVAGRDTETGPSTWHGDGV